MAQQNKKLEMQSVQIVSGILTPLLSNGVIPANDVSMIRRNLKYLATHGELAPAITPKLLTPQEVAEMLAISYSQMRALEKENFFPFKRRMLGNKTVRYLNTEVIQFIETGETNTEKEEEINGKED